MNYTEITVWTSSEAVEPLGAWFASCGIEGLAIEDRQDFERSYPDRFGELYALLEADFPAAGARVRAYALDLPNGMTEETVRSRVASFATYGIDPGEARVSFAQVNDEDWADAWKRYYHPTRITKRLTAVPSWESYEPAEGELLISLDPGMAFGTGTHPTTALLLRLLEEYLTQEDFVIDAGCGSGILSIAAAKLGARKILALDLDPIAVQVSKANCEINQVADKVDVRQNDLLTGLATASPRIIMSNILADILLRITEDAYQLLQEDGLLLLSGIISSRVDDLKNSLEQQGFTVERQLQEGDWNALAARKPLN
ncbi:MAG: ribosomal protein methyltransferase [Bacilli bacterium]|nr:ribosomal protein methyltransferase [Bacilli bacterium]